MSKFFYFDEKANLANEDFNIAQKCEAFTPKKRKIDLPLAIHFNTAAVECHQPPRRVRIARFRQNYLTQSASPNIERKKMKDEKER
jgi:hypothetical protein